jgi:hypothetical protein
MKLYKIYSGEELKIAEKIQQRRLQMLVHSYIYYDLNDNIVSDEQWAEWAYELKDLQETYPEIAKTVPYGQGFENWDASTGAFLPYREPNIISVARRLLHKPCPVSHSKVTTKSTTKSPKRKLF